MLSRASFVGGHIGLIMRAAVFALCMVLTSFPAAADPLRFGPFSIDAARRDVVKLDGPLDEGSALAFRRALAAAPDATLIVLNSDGGMVQMGLLVADDVYQRKMATLIPAGAMLIGISSPYGRKGLLRSTQGQA